MADTDRLRSINLEWLHKLIARCRVETDEEYIRFLKAHSKGALASGDFTPEYATVSEAGFDRMLALLPHAIVVFMMRDPVDRVWSAARMRRQQRGEDFAFQSKENLITFSRQPAVREMTNYSRTIRIARQRFPDLKTAVYEEVFASPHNAQSLVDDLVASLGVVLADDAVEIDAPVNIGMHYELPDGWADDLRQELDPIYEAARSEGVNAGHFWRH